MTKIAYRWGPVVLWAGAIFTVSSIPTLPKVGFIWWDFLLKKSAHIIEYAILYFLLIRALNISQNQKIFPIHINSKTWLIAFALALLYAISDEYHQSFVLGRTSKVTDIGFDTLGTLISGFLIKRKQAANK